VVNDFTIPVAFKAISCIRRAQLWNDMLRSSWT
jgi:hypothetical protein